MQPLSAAPPAPAPREVAAPAETAALAAAEAQLARGRTLVEALVEQLAAGQVETLYGLHTASAAVRRETTQVQNLLSGLQEASMTLESAVAGSADQLVDLLRTRMTERVEAWVDELVERQLQQPQQLADALVAAALEAQAAVATSAARAEQVLRAATARSVAQLEAASINAATLLSTALEAAADELLPARQALSLAAQEGVVAAQAASDAAARQLTASTSTFERALVEARYSLTETADRAGEELTQAGERLATLAGDAKGGVEDVGRMVVESIQERGDAFIAELEERLAVQAQRDRRVELEFDERVRKLVTRSDAAVARLSERLQREIDWLAARDQQQELLRADSFVAALERMLDQSGGGRMLGRVRDVIGVERRRRDQTVVATRVPAPDVTVEPVEPVEPVASVLPVRAEPLPPRRRPAPLAPAAPVAEPGPEEPAEKAVAARRRRPVPVRVPVQAEPTSEKPVAGTPRQRSPRAVVVAELEPVPGKPRTTTAAATASATPARARRTRAQAATEEKT